MINSTFVSFRVTRASCPKGVLCVTKNLTGLREDIPEKLSKSEAEKLKQATAHPLEGKGRLRCQRRDPVLVQNHVGEALQR
ncbi:hypothetical protein AV530_014935 [Patagioenas fasciata monilis]|uniref:Uncharacterized protein n=1 Tax=Patagioenas fasciata monilis TaxID=372326 RepID=A0A1V4K0K6_PATFA|nr:hypothetical protein AV530_014935 [Patagioenas fasciata monilis]